MSIGEPRGVPPFPEGHVSQITDFFEYFRVLKWGPTIPSLPSARGDPNRDSQVGNFCSFRALKARLSPSCSSSKGPHRFRYVAQRQQAPPKNEGTSREPTVGLWSCRQYFRPSGKQIVLQYAKLRVQKETLERLARFRSSLSSAQKH